MPIYAAFLPTGPLYQVGVSAVNCVTTSGLSNGSVGTSYRIKCIHTARQYITWGQTSAATTAVGAPGGSASANTFGMEPNQTEVFNGVGPWFIATAAAAFEVMPGEGV